MKRKEFLGSLGKGLIGGAAVLSGGATFLSGCSDLLNQDNPNNLTPSSFWKDADDANAGVASIYQIPSTSLRIADWKGRLIPTNYRGDDVGIRHDVPAYFSLALFTLTDTNSVAQYVWSLYYRGIFRTNQALEHIPSIEMDKSLRSRLVGESKFLRAFFYYNLLITYNNIPLITSVPKNNDYNVAQSSSKEVWGQIEKDLTDAVNVLPNSYDAANKARATKGTALGFLAKAEMFQKNWEGAADVLEQIINSKTYHLMPEFFDIFLEKNDLNNESLFEFNFTKERINGQNLSTPRVFEDSAQEAGGYYEYYPNKWLFNEMKKEKTINGDYDPRLYGTIIFPNDKLTYYGQSYQSLFKGNPGKLTWAKYSEWEFDHKIKERSGKNDRIMRYADVLLRYAEVLTRLDRKSDAISYINQVRNRANLSDFPSSASKQDVLREIEHQRVIELAQEVNRWRDLLRWNGSIDQSMDIKESLQAHGAIGADNFVPGKHEYLPIPLNELQTNTKMKQNPGY